MRHYNYLGNLENLWKAGLERYQAGLKKPGTILDEREEEFLKSLGLKVMDLFDYVEDYSLEGEPDWNSFAAICEVRRNYFLERQKGVFSDGHVKMEDLPPKSDSVHGITWLPRIIPKVLGKLRGELDPEIMYCCGGDREFFRTHDIHPAEFLRVAWAWEEESDKIVAWVLERAGER